MKKSVVILSIAIVILLSAYLSFQIFFRMAVPDYTGNIEINGLRSKVEVRSDHYGVPHIFANSDADLFFAQGYIIARERLFQMEITRLAGRGELSSLFGEKTIDKDELLKTIGIHRLAKKGYAALSPEARAAGSTTSTFPPSPRRTGRKSPSPIIALTGWTAFSYIPSRPCITIDKLITLEEI